MSDELVGITVPKVRWYAIHLCGANDQRPGLLSGHIRSNIRIRVSRAHFDGLYSFLVFLYKRGGVLGGPSSVSYTQ
jgi:hypothetical protein